MTQTSQTHGTGPQYDLMIKIGWILAVPLIIVIAFVIYQESNKKPPGWYSEPATRSASQ